MCAHNLSAEVPLEVIPAYAPYPTPKGDANFEHIYKFMGEIIQQIKRDLKRHGLWDRVLAIVFRVLLVHIDLARSIHTLVSFAWGLGDPIVCWPTILWRIGMLVTGNDGASLHLLHRRNQT